MVEVRPKDAPGVGLGGELRVAAARDDGQGMSRGGFRPGEVFTGTGVAGVVARITPDGAAVQNPWVTLPGETGQLCGGLYVDRTDVFGGDLIAVTTGGSVWRINSAGVATQVASLNTHLEGVVTVPNDPVQYGPWAGKILAGAKEQGAVYAVDAQGSAVAYQLGMNPQDIRIIPAHENFYGVDPVGRRLWGAPAAAFTSMIGDILIAQESPGALTRVHWNGTVFEASEVAEVAGWGQITFSPAGLVEMPAVKQTYEAIGVVRHGVSLSGGRVEGALWQLLGESVSLSGNAVITSDLLVPGTPTVNVSGHPSFGGVITGTGSAQPSNYTVSLSGNASVRHLMTRTDPIQLDTVASPPAPAGTRDVSLSQAGQPVGSFATLRHLSLSGKAGAVAVPPGTYGRFTASGRDTAFVLGSANSTASSVYNLESLSLSGGGELRVAGPVVLTVKSGVSLSGSSAGAAGSPNQLALRVAAGTVSVSGNGVLYAVVRAPQSEVSISGNGRIRGTVACDRLTVSGNGVIQMTENDLPSPPVNRPPVADAGPDQTITLPLDTISLNGSVSDDGLPAGGTLGASWTKVSGPGAVVFGDPASTSTSAMFTAPGIYVLRLTAADTLLTSRDDVTVNVIARNQPPTVDAGTDRTVEMPNAVSLSGNVADDALPAGSTVTVSWNVLGGPGSVSFADPNSATTTASFDAPGAYTLRLSATDTEFTVGDEMVVTVHPENQPPTANAGADQTFKLPNAATLNGAVADDGYPVGGTLTAAWSQVSGTGTVTFADASSPVTTASFSAPGTYVLRLVASDTRTSASDEVTINVEPANVAPTVNAGADQEVTLPGAANLNGSASDDGLPSGSPLAVTWSKVSGPGTVAFADAASVVTTAAVSEQGTYVLRLTSTDSQLSSSDELTVTVSGDNQSPTVNAGLDQTVKLADTVTLNGTVGDDGVPQGNPLTITWSKVRGPGAVTFSQPDAAATTATFSEQGDYVLRLSAGDSQITSSDTLTVRVEPGALYPLADAGPDQTVTLPHPVTLNGSVTDADGTIEYIEWWVAGGPGTVNFSNKNQAVTTASFSQPGRYLLGLSARSVEAVNINSINRYLYAIPAFVTITVNPPPPNQAPTVDAGTDQAITLPAPATLSGSASDDGLPFGSSVSVAWSKVSGPGAVTFASPNAVATSATFSAPGDYVLRLTASDSALQTDDTVNVSVAGQLFAPTAYFSVPGAARQVPATIHSFSSVAGGDNPATHLLDDSNFINWRTANGKITNQFVKLQLSADTAQLVERVRMERARVATTGALVKDFEVQVSDATDADADFTTVFAGTMQNIEGIQEFVFPGGAARARYVKLLAKNNYGSTSTIQLATFHVIGEGTADNIVSLLGQTNAARAQSPLLPGNGGSIHSFSSLRTYPPTTLLDYRLSDGGWQTNDQTDEWLKIELAGGRSHSVEGVRIRMGADGSGPKSAVKDFEVWVSNTTADDTAFTKVLTAIVPNSFQTSYFAFPGGPVQARFVKYVPLNTHEAGGSSIFTYFFDVQTTGQSRVIAASGSHNEHIPDAATDGIEQTSWYAFANTGTNQWVKVCWQAARSIVSTASVSTRRTATARRILKFASRRQPKTTPLSRPSIQARCPPASLRRRTSSSAISSMPSISSSTGRTATTLRTSSSKNSKRSPCPRTARRLSIFPASTATARRRPSTRSTLTRTTVVG